MNTRPQALRLADALEMDKWHITGVTAQQAADELRRLHNEILVYHDDRLKLSNEVDRLKAAQPAPVQEPVGYVAENGVVDWNVCAPPILTDLYTTPPSAPVQEPVNTLIAAWQALEETSGHVLDVGDVEGRMHMSVIRSAWEQMDSLVRAMWDERGRP